jgi:hypothetical protein
MFPCVLCHAFESIGPVLNPFPPSSGRPFRLFSEIFSKLIMTPVPVVFWSFDPIWCKVSRIFLGEVTEYIEVMSRLTVE